MSAVHVDDVAVRLRSRAFTQRRLAASVAADIAVAADALCSSLARGKKVLSFGNGGSAADAQHFAAELVGRFDQNRRALPAVALTTDSSAITAIANDFGFDEVFARQVCALGSPGDVALGISTSGRSRNVVRAVRAAREMGLTTIALSGHEGGDLAEAAHVSIVIPSSITAYIQECHIVTIHILCEIVDQVLFGLGRAIPHAAQKKVVGWDELDELREQWRQENRTVVWTNGCFDLLHVGHLRSLEQAKTLGDVLVVGVNSNGSVRALKGAGRPLVPAFQRAELLAGLDVVDHVVVFEEVTPIESLLRLRPDIHSKGADYAKADSPPLPEEKAVKSFGGRIVFLDIVDGISTTALLDNANCSGEGGRTTT